MIPKIIHYCWLSDDPIPQNLQNCMNSWKKYLPDYEFKLWNFDSFDINSSKWVQEAFDNKKYAFAADYIRLYALYHFGGIYMDMDVEVLKNIDQYLQLDTMIGWQDEYEGLEVAAFGVKKNEKWIEDCLAYYEGRHFKKNDGSFDTFTLPLIIEECLKKNGYKLETISSLNDAIKIQNEGEIPVFEPDFFSPKSFKTGVVKKTTRTVMIHHFSASWKNWKERLLNKIFGLRISNAIIRVKAKISGFIK